MNLVLASLKVEKCWACWKGSRQNSSLHFILNNPYYSAVLWTWGKTVSFSWLADPRWASDNLPRITALAGTLGAFLNCEKCLKILFIYTYSKLLFFFPPQANYKICCNHFQEMGSSYLSKLCTCCLCPIFFQHPHTSLCWLGSVKAIMVIGSEMIFFSCSAKEIGMDAIHLRCSPCFKYHHLAVASLQT